MSRTIDLFIDSPLSAADLAAELASRCELRVLAPDGPGPSREPGDVEDDALGHQGGDENGADENGADENGADESAPRPWRLAHGETVAQLAEHDYVDDGTLHLSRYRYVLTARLPAGTGVLDSAEAALLRRVLETVRAAGGVPALLTFDLQYRLGESTDAGPA